MIKLILMFAGLVGGVIAAGLVGFCITAKAVNDWEDFY